MAEHDEWMACVPQEKLMSIVSRLSALELESKANAADLAIKSAQIMTLQTTQAALEHEIAIKNQQLETLCAEALRLQHDAIAKQAHIRVLETDLEASRQEAHHWHEEFKKKDEESKEKTQAALVPAPPSVSGLIAAMRDMSLSKDSRAEAAAHLLEAHLFGLAGVPQKITGSDGKERTIRHVVRFPLHHAEDDDRKILNQIRLVVEIAVHRPRMSDTAIATLEGFTQGKQIRELLCACQIESDLDVIAASIKADAVRWGMRDRATQQALVSPLEMHVTATALILYSLYTRSPCVVSAGLFHSMDKIGDANFFQSTPLHDLLHRPWRLHPKLLEMLSVL